MTRPAVRDDVVEALRFQRDAPASSPLYQRILGIVVDDVERGGPCAEVLVHTPDDVQPIFDALPLRFLGGVHRLVLQGEAPDLAAFYPSAGGSFAADETPDDALAGAFLATVADHRDECVAALRRGVQTNEVGRCAALALGYLELSARFGLPLRILEIGTSAGLNLRWDLYRYEGGAAGESWGDPSSPVRFRDVYAAPEPPLSVGATVAERLGCDRSPIDATDPDGALLLRSFVWPDQLERFALLDAALGLAARAPVTIEHADAGSWVLARLAEPAAGSTSVVVHSIVWQYLSPDCRQQVLEALRAYGARATADAPLAWLRMEPGQDPVKAAEVRLTTWPGGDERLVATTGYHGRPVRWRVP